MLIDDNCKIVPLWQLNQGDIFQIVDIKSDGVTLISGLYRFRILGYKDYGNILVIRVDGLTTTILNNNSAVVKTQQKDKYRKGDYCPVCGLTSHCKIKHQECQICKVGHLICPECGWCEE